MGNDPDSRDLLNERGRYDPDSGRFTGTRSVLTRFILGSVQCRIRPDAADSSRSGNQIGDGFYKLGVQSCASSHIKAYSVSSDSVPSYLETASWLSGVGASRIDCNFGFRLDTRRNVAFGSEIPSSGG